MAKAKKSRVSRVLPDIEQTDKTVADLTGKELDEKIKKTTEMIKVELETTKDLKDKSNKLANDYDPNKYPSLKKGKGRPKATHGKKRFTTLLEKDSIEIVKIISSVTGLEQNEIYSEAVKDYIDKFKKEYPDKFKLVEATLKVKKHP